MIKTDKTTNKKWSTQKLITTGMLAAIAGVLMSFEISLPMMPPFYKLDFSDVPSIIALFLMGPASATAVEIIKILIKMFTVGTNSMYVGEVANIIGIVLFILPTWLIYKFRGKTLRAAVEALVASIFIRIGFSCLVNAFITLPLYCRANETTMEAVIGFVGTINPKIKNLPTFIVLGTIPFNFIKNTLNCAIGYVLFDRLVKIPSIKNIEVECIGRVNQEA